MIFPTRDNLDLQDYTLTNYKKTSRDKFASYTTDKGYLSLIEKEILEILKDPDTQISGSMQNPLIEFRIPAPYLSDETYTYGPWNSDLYVSADCYLIRDKNSKMMISLYSNIVDSGKILLPQSLIVSRSMIQTCIHHKVELSHPLIQNYMLL